MGENFGRDSIWETQLAEELWNTEVELDVVLDEQVMKLGEIIDLKPGSQIVLNTGPDGAVLIRCGSVTMFEGKIGRRKNRVAVRIEREVVRNRESDRP
jgi:flagellar motor switch protein FliM